MNNENEIISRILRNFRKSPLHKNEFFLSDSEVINLGGKNFLFSVDGYSDEDHFRLDNPFNLGANLATCTISDIFACGGKPILFSNSFNSDPSWDADYIDQIAKGMASVIGKCGAGFIGGDYSRWGKWNFTGVVIGEAERIVTRKGAGYGDIIYITGHVGAGNFEAASVLLESDSSAEKFFAMNPVVFPIRLEESTLISKYATSSIDTSDGLYRSLEILAGVNNCGYYIHDIPYFPPGLVLTKNARLPKETLMFGECGEYELLFTVSPENESSLLNDAKNGGCGLYRIGDIAETGCKQLKTESGEMSLNNFNVFARDFYDHLEYIGALTQFILSRLQK